MPPGKVAKTTPKRGGSRPPGTVGSQNGGNRTDWQNPTTLRRFITALVGSLEVQGTKFDYPLIAQLFGESTPGGIAFQFREFKASARQLKKQLAEQNGGTIPRTIKTTPSCRGVRAGSSVVAAAARRAASSPTPTPTLPATTDPPASFTGLRAASMEADMEQEVSPGIGTSGFICDGSVIQPHLLNSHPSPIVLDSDEDGCEGTADPASTMALVSCSSINNLSSSQPMLSASGRCPRLVEAQDLPALSNFGDSKLKVGYVDKLSPPLSGWTDIDDYDDGQV